MSPSNLAIFSATLLTPAQIGSPPWSERDVFVLGGGVLIDFHRQREIGSGPSPYNLVNCSTRDLYCARGERTRIVLPRRCADWQVGDSWERMGVGTEVLGRFEAPLNPHLRAGRQRLMMGDAALPFIVYEYTPRAGIIGAWFDPTGRTDLVALAQSGELPGRMNEGAARYWPMLTLDPFAECQPA